VSKNRHFSVEKWRFCQYLGIFPGMGDGARVLYPGGVWFGRVYTVSLYAQNKRKNAPKIDFIYLLVYFIDCDIIARFWAF
jgi:hypothetical protein